MVRAVRQDSRLGRIGASGGSWRSGGFGSIGFLVVSRDTPEFPVSVDRRLRPSRGDLVIFAGSVLSGGSGGAPGFSIGSDRRFGRFVAIGRFRFDRFFGCVPGHT